MRKKKLMSIFIVTLAVFSIISISKVVKNYSDKPNKMIYYLRDSETVKQAAEKFNVSPEDIKADGRYLMFYVK